MAVSSIQYITYMLMILNIPCHGKAFRLSGPVCSAVDVWEWRINFISHFTGHVITNPCWNYSQSMLSKGAPGVSHFPDNKVHGANMGITWVLSAPDGPHVGPMNLALIIKYVPNSRVGVTKPISSVPLFSKIFSIVKTHVSY